jgi:hypothetical protein
MAGPPTDYSAALLAKLDQIKATCRDVTAWCEAFDDMPTGSGWTGPSPNACHHPFSCASRAEHTELLTMYALTRRKVLSQAEEIERLKAER